MCLIMSTLISSAVNLKGAINISLNIIVIITIL